MYFPLNQFYEVLNEAYLTNDDESTICILIMRYMNGDNYYTELCKKLKGILDNWDHILKIFFTRISVNKSCEYLNY